MYLFLFFYDKISNGRFHGSVYLFTGVASAFAARDILGNVFSGLSMQFSKPFSIGDTIKVC